MIMKLTTVFLVYSFLLVQLQSQWISNIPGSATGDLSISNARGLAIAVDNSEYSYVTGYISNENTGNDIVLIKYDPEGDTVWMKYYNGTEDSDDEGCAISLGSDGSIYVVGTVRNNFTGRDIIVLKYKSTGELEWASNYSYLSVYADDIGNDLVVDNNGNIYITGSSKNSAGNTILITQKYSADGTQIWSSFEEYIEGSSGGVKIACDDSGNSYVVGYIPRESSTDIIVLKYDASGNVVFRQTSGGEGEDKAWGIAVDDDSFIYITGYHTNSSFDTDCYTAKYDSTGVLVWEQNFDGTGNSEDKAWGIAVDDDAVYITGSSTDLTNNVNFVTIKYDLSGNTEWTSFYDGTGNGRDQANAIGLIEQNGSTTAIAVVGESWGVNGNYDYAAVRYNSSTGSELSVNRYSMSETTDDIAVDLAISVQNGKIYLTGYSQLIIESMFRSSSITSVMYLPLNSEIKNNEVNVPHSFELKQNYPNPFNPSTKISFSIPQNSQLSLVVYDLLGRTVDVLLQGELKAGNYELEYSNSSLSSGVYFYELKAGSFRDIKKMVLLK